MLLVAKPAIAGRLLQLVTRRLDEIKHGLVEAKWTAKRVTGHDHAGAAVPFILVIKGKLNLGTHPERPLRQQTDALRRPFHVFLNEID